MLVFLLLDDRLRCHGCHCVGLSKLLACISVVVGLAPTFAYLHCRLSIKPGYLVLLYPGAWRALVDAMAFLGILGLLCGFGLLG